MKVKCSGSQPCTRCDRKHVTCQFPATDKRVSVPERYVACHLSSFDFPHPAPKPRLTCISTNNSYLRALEGRQDGSALDPFLENETWSSRQLHSRNPNVGAQVVDADEGSMTSGRGEMVDPGKTIQSIQQPLLTDTYQS